MTIDLGWIISVLFEEELRQLCRLYFKENSADLKNSLGCFLFI